MNKRCEKFSKPSKNFAEANHKTVAPTLGHPKVRNFRIGIFCRLLLESTGSSAIRRDYHFLSGRRLALISLLSNGAFS